MRRLYKRVTTVALAAAMVLSLPAAGMTVKADAAAGTQSGDVYVSFGADLSSDEKKTVMDLMGITEDDLEDYTVGEITNEEEHEYLGDYLDSSVIGSRALWNQCRDEEHILLYKGNVYQCIDHSRY